MLPKLTPKILFVLFLDMAFSEFSLYWLTPGLPSSSLPSNKPATSYWEESTLLSYMVWFSLAFLNTGLSLWLFSVWSSCSSWSGIMKPFSQTTSETSRSRTLFMEPLQSMLTSFSPFSESVNCWRMLSFLVQRLLEKKKNLFFEMIIMWWKNY